MLSLYRSTEAAEGGGAPIARLDNEDATLETYGVQEMYCIKVSQCEARERSWTSSSLRAMPPGLPSPRSSSASVLSWPPSNAAGHPSLPHSPHTRSHQVDNTDPMARPGEFTDVSAVDKFELTDAEYAARRDTVQAHLKANKLGKYADVPQKIAFAPPPPSSAPPEVVVGTRCEVGSDRGTVRFVGRAEIGKGGVWVGVELDEPMGRGDGR